VRGPATGEARGESNSLGIKGLRVRFPEINLQLPSIELPSLYSIRRDAEMEFDGTRGPYVQGQPAEFRMVEAEDRGAGDNKGGPGQDRCAPQPGFAPTPTGAGDQPTVDGPFGNPMPPTPAAEAAYRARELELREQELALLRLQVQEMQAQLRDLSSASSSVAPSPARTTTPVALRPRRVEPAAYVEAEETSSPPTGFGLSQPTKAKSVSAPPPSRPVGRTNKAPATPRTATSNFGDWASDDR